MAAIGMSTGVSPSPAGATLGFGNNNNMSIADQVANETEEEKRRRLLAMQQNQRPGLLGGGFSNALGTMSSAGSFLGATS
jgi:hypothetical protein